MRSSFSGCFHLLVAVLVAISMLAVPCSVMAAEPAVELAPIRDLLEQPAFQVDLARAKIAIDRTIDPAMDERKLLAQLDTWTAKINARVQAGATRDVKLGVILTTLYQPGPWNDGHPFSYEPGNTTDPDLNAQLLATYLETRKGNEVSMPILLVILAQRLDLPATLAMAPGHLLVKVVDDDGQWINIDATIGEFRYDNSYEQALGISPKAIDNGVYLRPLDSRESVAAMLETLMVFYRWTGRHDLQVAVADLALSVNADDVVAMHHKGDAYHSLLQERYVSRYPDPAQIPSNLQPDFQWLSREHLHWYAHAEALGWVDPTTEKQNESPPSIQQEWSDVGALP